MRRLGLMLLCLGAVLAAVAVINWVVNPYGAWRSTAIDPVYRFGETTRNEADERVRTAYRIRAEQPVSLLVGSSRVVVGMYIDRGARDGFFNASMSGASLAEIAAILRLATANPRLERVIGGVDFYAFDARFVGFRHPEARARLEGDEQQMMAMRIKETLLSLRALNDSWKVIRRARRGHRPGPFAAPVPWPEETIRAGLAEPGRPGLAQADDASLKAQLVNWVANYSQYRPAESLGDLFRRAVGGVRAAGVEVVLFVPPLSRCELEVIDRTGSWGAFRAWKRRLLDAGPYWDFSGFGKLDTMDSLFLDVTHFWPAVGHVMLRQFLGQDCGRCGAVADMVRGAGVWVDAASIDAYFAQQDTARQVARSSSHRCARVVEEMLRERESAARTRGALSLGAYPPGNDFGGLLSREMPCGPWRWT
jgi:hypothetical protein